LHRNFVQQGLIAATPSLCSPLARCPPQTARNKGAVPRTGQWQYPNANYCEFSFVRWQSRDGTAQRRRDVSGIAQDADSGNWRLPNSRARSVSISSPEATAGTVVASVRVESRLSGKDAACWVFPTCTSRIKASGWDHRRRNRIKSPFPFSPILLLNLGRDRETRPAP
jgi:hypothetical protein